MCYEYVSDVIAFLYNAWFKQERKLSLSDFRFFIQFPKSISYLYCDF